MTDSGNSGRHRLRFPLMALAVFGLLVGLWAGLMRLGWALPAWHPALALAHGPLMISGFLGTIIALERAVALQSRWAYAPPLLTGLGALAGGVAPPTIAGLPRAVDSLLITAGSLGMVAVSVAIVRRQLAFFTVTMGLGAVTWLIGNALWLAGWSIPQVVPWWAGFLILTIVGERLELSRLLRPSRLVQAAFVAATALFCAGLIWSVFDFSAGWRVTGLGMLALALWLIRNDIARRTVRQSGLTRFIAVCLMAGYVWLGIGGLLALIQGGMVAGPRYDAILHAVLLGFVFSMIFGHAPIIFPAVLRISVPYRRSFYGHLILLHASLLLREVGDLAGWASIRQAGGLLNVIALLVFLANTARAARNSVTESPAPRGSPGEARRGA